MADFSRTSIIDTANISIDRSASKINTNKTSYWKQMLKSYEKRNASLERRRSVLVDKVRFMECTLPSLLMSVAASTVCGKQGIHSRDEQTKSPENVSKSTVQKA